MSKKEKDLNWLGNKVLNSSSSPKSSSNSSTVTADGSVSGATAGDPAARRNSTDTSLIFEQGPPPATDRSYLGGYLAKNIGKNIRAEFLLGTSILTDKAGILKEVGVNYFVLEDYISRARIVCDLYSVRFVTIL